MRKIAAVVAVLLLVAESDGSADIRRGAPELVVVVGAHGYLAVDSDCRFYRRHLDPTRYEFEAQGPLGRPVSLVEEGVGTSRYKLGMANGDVYEARYVEGVGLSFTFEANVFGSPVSTSSRSWSAVKQGFTGSTRR